MHSTHGPRRYSPAEEIAHSLTHGVGLLLGIAALILMVVISASHGTAVHVVSSAVFGTTLILLYATSTLYHALPPGPAKRVFRVLDHAAIFLLIAGTYTPFTLVTMRGPWGWSLFGIVWGSALSGILLEAFTGGRGRRLQLALYLAMGWSVVAAVRPLVQRLETGGLVLLVAGGLAYTAGILFYLRRSLRFHHAIWHVFVLAGSICHFFAVLLYVMP